MRFDFENLEVYERALELVDEAFGIVRSLTREFRFPVGDQVIRAALSITNNIAEGSGKDSKRDKARYYGMALDSARECAAIVTVLVRQELLSRDGYQRVRGMIWRVSSMLFRLRDATLPRYTVHGSR